MERSCVQCGSPFEILQEDLAFYDRISPTFTGRKFSIPPPNNCPECRQQRRLAICNELNLYPGKCDLCQREMITQFPPGNRFPIYCRECWHSDRWDARTYGQSFDFSRPFFEQFGELRSRVPALGLDVQGTLINCEYIHFAGSSKNCYLIMHADFCEDCMYGYGFKKNIACVDGFYNLHCELCYDCVDIHKCYGLIGSQDCINCHSSAFLRDCIGCRNCFLCVGLREKEYCFENKQFPRKEYMARTQEIDLSSHTQYQACAQKRKELERTHTFKYLQGHNLERCTGDHLVNCKDTFESFDCEDVEGGKHCYQIVLGAKNIQDIYQYGTNLQASYECAIVGENSYHLLFSFGCHMGSADLSYCWYMESCRDCFGCTLMQRSRYCILNKQYSKEEYEHLVPRIIDHMQRTGEWGEFFPTQLSPFGYNKTTAQLYYPLTKEQALARRAQWSDYEPPLPKVAKIIPAHLLPDNTKDIPDDVLNWAITCEITRRPFRITPQELRFYRKVGLPVPRRDWLQRHLDRFQQRNPRKLWQRQCSKCGKEIQTTYPPERQEVVYCEHCYLAAVY